MILKFYVDGYPVIVDFTGTIDIVRTGIYHENVSIVKASDDAVVHSAAIDIIETSQPGFNPLLRTWLTLHLDEEWQKAIYGAMVCAPMGTTSFFLSNFMAESHRTGFKLEGIK